MRITVPALAKQLQTEADAWKFMEDMRWPEGVVCPACHGSDVYLIVPKNGCSRRTSSGSMSERRTWYCRSCKRQFSATTGTIMHGTKVALRTWVLVIFEMMASKNGIAGREIERKYGLCSRTAWFLMHRIREAMKDEGVMATMRGTIVADETFIGGNPGRMNRKTYARWHDRHYPWMHQTEKTPVVSLINAETGVVRSAVVPKVTGANLRKFMSENVDMAGSTLWTDEGSWYFQLGKEFIEHATVNHSAEEYVGPNGQGINKAENFFSQLKRSLDGTHHHVSVEHLPRYLAEFDYRYTTKHLSDGERMADLIERCDGRRLTYKRVKAA